MNITAHSPPWRVNPGWGIHRVWYQTRLGAEFEPTDENGLTADQVATGGSSSVFALRGCVEPVRWIDQEGQAEMEDGLSFAGPAYQENDFANLVPRL